MLKQQYPSPMLKFWITFFIALSQCFGAIFSIAEENSAIVAVQADVAQTQTKENADKIIFGGSKVGLKINPQQSSDATFNLAFDKTISPREVDFNLRVFETSEALIEAFYRGEINALLASPLELLALEGKTGETLMAVNDHHAPAKQSFVLLVRKSDAISDIKQLSQKRISIAPLQDVATLYLNTLLLDHRVPEISKFFSEVFESKNANIAVMDVFFGKSDITIVREDEYKQAISLNPQVEAQLVVLEKSPPFLSLVGASKKSVDEKMFKQALRAITGVTKTVAGKKLFKVVNTDELQAISRADLLEVNALLTRYKTLSKNKEMSYVE